MKVKRTEQGWPAHFCCSHRCFFRRNTLLQLDNVNIIVSTVGNYNTGNEIEEIGVGRYYETFIFNAHLYKGYWEINGSNISIGNLKWAIREITNDTDKEANEMHENTVSYLLDLMEKDIKFVENLLKGK